MKFLATFLTTFPFAAVLSYGGSQPAAMPVSAIVLTGAKIEVLSSTEARVQVVLRRNTQALAWLTSGTCDSPVAAQVLLGSGVHRVTFPDRDAAGKTLCVASTDGAVRVQSRMDAQ